MGYTYKCFYIRYKPTIAGTEYTIADLIVHKYNMKDGGNVNPRQDYQILIKI